MPVIRARESVEAEPSAAQIASSVQFRSGSVWFALGHRSKEGRRGERRSEALPMTMAEQILNSQANMVAFVHWAKIRGNYDTFGNLQLVQLHYFST